ncbi:hypothetical protein PBY51_022840 [Eleginops maclovinus]|uniref:Uncharacterized protein n=1 Tax=Eleginops maclovinus TaxID=56733 RepID=A0AAN7XIP5_ELEMC|nr:hypothetical protein PBY51_022840 [Eleginops maclovinus]
MRTSFGVLFLLTLWVVYSDAWLWGWTGTTTMPPTVDHEGSGSSEGSGEPSPENIAMVRSEMIDEGHGIQKVAQTWDQTTEGLRLTPLVPTTQPRSGGASEKGTEGISSRIRKPGKGKSSIKGMGLEGSDYLSFTGMFQDLDLGLSLNWVQKLGLAFCLTLDSRLNLELHRDLGLAGDLALNHWGLLMKTSKEL